MIKTAECVSQKHPDKLCDQISDAILDECLRQDPMSRVAIETMGGHGIITITGELTTKAFVDARKIAQSIVGESYGVQTNIVSQSPEISQGVDTGGAGDQGIMVGYACDDNEAMIPQELYVARSLCKFIYEKYPYDGKTQITIDDKGKIKEIVASFQNVNRKDLLSRVCEWAIEVMNLRDNDFVMHINSAGDWSIGGFDADTGLTGRKIIVDNYGPQVTIGGGCFSGKDATKVDRSGAYMARKIAVDLLKKYQAKVVKVNLAYVIGVNKPVMANAIVANENFEVKEIDLLDNHDNIHYPLTPKGIIEYLDLRKPQFEKTAQWGHFGNDFVWDK